MSAFLLALTLAVSGASGSDALINDPIFVDANRLFSDLEFEQAAFRFEQLGLRSTLPTADRAVVLMWLGTSQAKAGDLESASRSYELALSLDPAAQPPVAMSPKATRLIEAIRKKVVDAGPPNGAAAADETAPKPDEAAPSPVGTKPVGSEPVGGKPVGDEPARASTPSGSTPNVSPPSVANEDAETGSTLPPNTESTSSSAADAVEGDEGALPLLPLSIGAGAIALASFAAVVGFGVFGALDLGAALDPATTQVEAVERYGRGAALSAVASASGALLVGSTATAVGALLLAPQDTSAESTQ